MHFIGIDIGSTATKVAVRGRLNLEFSIPTGWNSKDTAIFVKNKLKDEYKIDIDDKDTFVVSTGYGRISVPYSNKSITEITCHARGISEFAPGGIYTVIDVGGQDTKVISVKNEIVEDFIMNDKCSAGTGRFLEIMADKLGITLDELFKMAVVGTPLKISSMCTVFAESEVIGLMGSGYKREDIAAGVVDSVVMKILQLARRHGIDGEIVLTGGLSVSKEFVRILSNKLESNVITDPKCRFAGAIGAAILANEKYKRRYL